MASSKTAPRPSSDKKRSKDKKSKKSKKDKSTSKKVVEKESFKSSEYVADSDKEDDEEELRSATNSNADSDEDSLPENLASIKSKTNVKAIAKTATASASESEDDDKSGSGSKNDTDSESDDEEVETEITKSTKKPASNPPKDSTTKTVSFVAPAPYKPPAGFEIVPVEGDPKASQLFKKSNLQGKQIWYITAPASVPITLIENMSLQNTNNGTVAVSQNGDDYGFVHDTVEDKTYTKIMVPSSSKDGYFTDVKPIDQILHLQQIVKLPTVYNSSIDTASSRATIPAKKPIRQQPKGLKMRYRPIGFGDGAAGKIGSNPGDESTTESDADEDMQDASPTFRRPSLSESTGNEESDLEMNAAPPSSSKHSTKSKLEKGADRSLKRKHNDSHEARENDSSFRSTTVHNKKLKKTKTSQINSQGSIADKQSVSTNLPKTISPIPLPKKVSKISPAIESPIRPPKSKLNSSLPASSPPIPKRQIPLPLPNVSRGQASTSQRETRRAPSEDKRDKKKKHS